MALKGLRRICTDEFLLTLWTDGANAVDWVKALDVGIVWLGNRRNKHCSTVQRTLDGHPTQ